MRGLGRAPARPSSLFAVPNVTAHPSTASVPITVLPHDGPLLCGFNVAIKGLTVCCSVLSTLRSAQWTATSSWRTSSVTRSSYSTSSDASSLATRALTTVTPWRRAPAWLIETGCARNEYSRFVSESSWKMWTDYSPFCFLITISLVLFSQQMALLPASQHCWLAGEHRNIAAEHRKNCCGPASQHCWLAGPQQFFLCSAAVVNNKTNLKQKTD